MLKGEFDFNAKSIATSVTRIHDLQTRIYDLQKICGIVTPGFGQKYHGGSVNSTVKNSEK